MNQNWNPPSASKARPAKNTCPSYNPVTQMHLYFQTYLPWNWNKALSYKYQQYSKGKLCQIDLLCTVCNHKATDNICSLLNSAKTSQGLKTGHNIPGGASQLLELYLNSKLEPAVVAQKLKSSLELFDMEWVVKKPIPIGKQVLPPDRSWKWTARRTGWGTGSS